jgi:hypothetical protein
MMVDILKARAPGAISEECKQRQAAGEPDIIEILSSGSSEVSFGSAGAELDEEVASISSGSLCHVVPVPQDHHGAAALREDHDSSASSTQQYALFSGVDHPT